MKKNTLTGLFIGVIIMVCFFFGIRVSLTRSQPKIFVGLMNANEAKPFGGFFGSFVLIEIKPWSIKWSIHDSYEPQTKTPYRHPLPSRYHAIMPLGDGKIGMLGANMLGWTAMDAATIRAVTEQAYNYIPDRTILVSSDVFSSILPSWDQTVHYRQFLNATVDIRRGIITGNKKNDTFAAINNYLSSPGRWVLFLRKAISSLRNNHRNGLIHIDPPASASRLIPWLTSKQRHRRYHPSSLYRGWYNLSFNKIDERTSTISTLYHHDTPYQSTSGRTIPLASTGSFRLIQTMATIVPDEYSNRINQWAKDAGITLTSRERTILSLDPSVHRRHVFFFPPHTVLGPIIGLEKEKIVSTDDFVMVIGDVRGTPPMTHSIIIPFVLESQNILRTME